MYEYIKKKYVSPGNDGKTNIETEWKITSDEDGTQILDQIAMSSKFINSCSSKILVGDLPKVYIWYNMKFSNSTTSGWIGPTIFIPRKNNVTNDLKPITRVNTPSVRVDTTNKDTDKLILLSSEFSGDPLDGHLATTYIFKNGRIPIYTEMFVKNEKRFRLELDKVTTKLNKYKKLTVFIKHHSNNGLCSDFGIYDLDLRTYMFDYVGPTVLDFNKPFEFKVNTPTADVEVGDVEIIHKKQGVVFKGEMSLNKTMIIPSKTLEADRAYTLRLHSTDTTTREYMDIPITTRKVFSSVDYRMSGVYDWGESRNTKPKALSPSIKPMFRGNLVNDRIFNVTDTNFSILKVDKDSKIPVELKLVSSNYISDAYSTYVNTTEEGLYLLEDKGTTFRLTKHKYNGSELSTESGYEIVVPSKIVTDASLSNTATVSPSGRFIFAPRINSNTNKPEIVKIDTETKIVKILPGVPETTVNDFNKLSLCAVSDDTLVAFSVANNYRRWYAYDTYGNRWVIGGVIPDNKPTDSNIRLTLVANKKIIIQGLTDKDDKIVMLDINSGSKDIAIKQRIGNSNYNISINSDGSLIFYNKVDNNYVRIPLKDINK